MITRTLACLLAVCTSSAAAVQLGSNPARQTTMHGYLESLDRMVTAVIRGELDDVRPPATTLANAPPPSGLPDVMTRHALALAAAARQTAAAPSLVAAAAGIGHVLSACGACHQATRANASVRETPTSILAGTPAHMVAHRQAVDRLIAGLLAPSDREWREGARALAAAPLHAQGAPGDVPMRPVDLRIEEAVHRLADDAAGADAIDSRVRVFGTLIARCADCHASRTRPPAR